ncbi:RNA pseudouridine synthase [Spirochaetia bacterium]|nr:RNA pseudouridine synthase [Spirochaetia bacterium]
MNNAAKCPPESLASRILYQNERYLIVNKIPGEAVEGANTGMIDLPQQLDSLLSRTDASNRTGGLLLSRHPRRSSLPEAVNRLDVPVSGCTLFALSPEAQAAASALFRKGAVEKHYWAIIEAPEGLQTMPSGELVHWIGEDRRHSKSIAFDDEAPGRKKALLRCRIRGRGDRYVFLDIELITGRRHQIRAQLAALGFHIKGDLKYGAKRSEKNGGIRLHARSLRFQDPGPDGALIEVTAPPPLMDPLWEAFIAAAE